MVGEQTPLKKAQEILTDMLVTTAEICEKFNITYWLTDGTLLGTIRHKGFIPWDDDADIGMLRKDYEKFRKVVENQLPDQYKVLPVKDPRQPQESFNWLKIYYVDDFLWEGPYGETNVGLSIDIFPFDYVPEPNRLSKIGKMINKIAQTGYPKKILTKKHYWDRFLRALHIHKLYIPFNKKTSTLTYGVETIFYGWSFYDLDDIFPLKEAQFEGHTFKIPNNYDQYLKKAYGDYMVIPDEADRHTHLINLRFKEN